MHGFLLNVQGSLCNAFECRNSCFDKMQAISSQAILQSKINAEREGYYMLVPTKTG